MLGICRLTRTDHLVTLNDIQKLYNSRDRNQEQVDGFIFAGLYDNEQYLEPIQLYLNIMHGQLKHNKLQHLVTLTRPEEAPWFVHCEDALN